MFFKKRKPASTNKTPQFKLLWSKTFTQSGSFKGFRRINLSRYYSDAVDNTLDTLKKQKYNLKGRAIRLDHLESLDPYNKFRVVCVYVDDMLIGSVFSSDEKYYPMLTEYKYNKAYVRIEDSAPDFSSKYVVTAKAYLFVNYPDVAPIKVDVTVE